MSASIPTDVIDAATIALHNKTCAASSSMWHHGDELTECLDHYRLAATATVSAALDQLGGITTEYAVEYGATYHPYDNRHQAAEMADTVAPQGLRQRTAVHGPWKPETL